MPWNFRIRSLKLNHSDKKAWGRHAGRRAGSLVYMSCHDEVHEEVTKNPIMHSKSEKRARAREPLQSRSFIQEIRDTNDVAARGA